MEILFLSHRIPYPPTKGDKVRSYAMFTHLAKTHRIHLACFVDDPADLIHVDRVREIAGGECLFVPIGNATKWLRAAGALLTSRTITTAYLNTSVVSKWLKQISQNHPLDGAVVFSSGVAPYLLDGSVINPKHAILDLVDVDSDKWRQYAAEATGVKRRIFNRESSKLLQFERLAAQKYGATILASPHEAASFMELAPESASHISPLTNGVDLNYFSPGEFASPFQISECPIVMTGRMDYYPNIEGARWFHERVMPQLASRLPAARFYVVGSHPPKSLRALAGVKLVVTGQVDDVRPYIQHAQAVVAPLRIARGVQNKVLEAMAMGKPVVATHEATRAFSEISEAELWIENEPSAFADAVIAATTGLDRAQIGRNARRYVELHHNWCSNLTILNELLARLGKTSTDSHQANSDEQVSGLAHPTHFNARDTIAAVAR